MKGPLSSHSEQAAQHHNGIWNWEKALANALCNNCLLTFLDIGYNKLGGKALADTLCKSSILTSLDISDNNLEFKEGKALIVVNNKLGLDGEKALVILLCKKPC
ncbi:hypothetical protein C2G38_2178608 [Gigaspora rosea]|uniref:Uncharacterized protein n=1 Tax=Gigaspora rosea TaxID=44941 RepID=A0A397VE49_9GLOM|nr:hypothetical protein C2G38_2178608 [Gigaspora rosea]